MFSAGRVGVGGSVPVGSRREGLSRVLSSMEFGDEEDKGAIGRALSGDGARGMERKGGALGLSLRNAPSTMMFVVGRVSTRLSIEKDVVLVRKIGRGVSCAVWRASFVGTWRTRERAGGRSGERGGRDDFSEEDRSGMCGSRRAWVRLESPVEMFFAGRVGVGGSESIRPRREGLSRVLSRVLSL